MTTISALDSTLLKSKTALVSGTVCTLLGIFATMQYASGLLSGTVNAVEYNALLLPVGIALLDSGRFFRWVARIQLFVMALVSFATVTVFLLMSDDGRAATFELHDNIGTLSGTGIILLSQGLLFAAALWIYFSIFADPVKRQFTTDGYPS